MRYWFLFPITFTIIAIASASLWQLATGGSFGLVAWVNIFIPEILFWNMWGLAAPAIFFVSRKFSYEFQPFSWKWLIHIPLAVVIIFCTYAVYIGLFSVYYQLCAWLDLPINGEMGAAVWGRVVSLMGFGLPLGAMVYGLLLAIPQIKGYYERMRQEEQRSQTLKTQLAEAELQALKMQLQPHFLFNSLNTISATLQTDTHAADRMIAQLGDFLRLTLEHADRAIVSLKEELEFNRRYLEIEKHRFEERLQVYIDATPEAETAAVPYLILQPLIENAIRHGIGQQLDNGSVTIDARRDNGLLVLNVKNSGPHFKEALSPGEYGVGLSNTQSRLLQQYGDNASMQLQNLEPAGVHVQISIPYTRYS